MEGGQNTIEVCTHWWLWHSWRETGGSLVDKAGVAVAIADNTDVVVAIIDNTDVVFALIKADVGVVLVDKAEVLVVIVEIVDVAVAFTDKADVGVVVRIARHVLNVFKAGVNRGGADCFELIWSSGRTSRRQDHVNSCERLSTASLNARSRLTVTNTSGSDDGPEQRPKAYKIGRGDGGERKKRDQRRARERE